ncbi:AN1-type zinc finger protein 6 isoform X1 [Drosophila mojavensis]|uniref:Uncharacterized protein, isoform B n=1 Tax=Drosophila mojavensis TaxID=7230 RepID=A0A0Q9X5N5_DROMO|nr:AN1-type zinc finger protein 6 isoform X1 [Drosophila mojavensis]KRG00740.1 uncharacterized protein Dmoj_GI24002, isoform B [Drosophila mojavensis]
MEQSNGDKPEKPRQKSDHRLAQPQLQPPSQQQPQPQQQQQQQQQPNPLPQQQQQQSPPHQHQHQTSHSKRRIKETSSTEESPIKNELVQHRKPLKGAIASPPVDAVVKKRKITEEAAVASKSNSEAIIAASGPNTSTQAAASACEQDDKDKEDDKDAKKKKNRCGECRKKVGLTGFQCRCGGLYCAVHRYSDKHNCTFDYREHGAQEIRRNNPVVVGEKIQKI